MTTAPLVIDRAPGRFGSWPRLLTHSPEITMFIGVIVVAALAHAVNMSNFPYYENDEGIYMSQAWAVVHQGQLAP